MANSQVPTIDEENPFYCPSISALSYLATLRQSLQSNVSQLQDGSLRAFFWKLGSGFVRQDISPAMYPEQVRADGFLPTSSSPAPPSPWIQGRFSNDPISYNDHIRELRLLRLQYAPNRPQKRKEDSSDSSSLDDLRGPAKRKKSSATAYASSLRLGLGSETRGPLFPVRRGFPFYKDDLDAPALLDNDFNLKYGPDAEDESPGDIANLVVRLSLLLPGVGIRHSLLGHIHLFQLTHQRIATTLADRGLLNEEVLTAIRGTRVQHLNLGPSLSDEDGLNLQGATALRAFRRPGTFTSLTELALSGACIRDSDLVHIQHLPALQKLELECIGIGNEGVFLLISLKHTLTHLDLAHNPKIDDEAIPALLIFPGLSYLSLFGTGVDMPGLRRLALVIHKEDRVIDIEIPQRCDQYISDMDHKYLIYPSPPLTIEPCTVPLLSKAALKRNLAAHALINPDIVSSGTRREMIERLLKILEMREGDIVVRDMVLGDDSEKD